nr:tRNA lysidine(34) synthetase TilS [Schlegelella koreensis]
MPTRPVVTLAIAGPGSYDVPIWNGALHVDRVDSGGVAAQRLERLELRLREGGERFQLGPGRPPRPLKKQYQAVALPEWERTGPLVFSAGELVFVPGLGLDARALAPPGAPQYALGWEPRAPI